VAFGKPLLAQPLHVETLAELEVEWTAGFHLALRLAHLLGRDECGEASDDERVLLRLLTPVAKLYTGKQVVAVASETLEAFGGAGYVEDTRLPVLLRDAQVLSIWEGTTNVLSLDVLRALERERAWGPFAADVARRLDGVRAAELREPVERVRAALRRLESHVARSAGAERASLEAGARAFAFSLARTYAAALLLEHADWAIAQGGDRRPVVAAERWCRRELTPLADADAAWREGSDALLGGATPAGGQGPGPAEADLRRPKAPELQKGSAS
jgi:alkylation response protein AidB-like acyl-CoA dehydrogenase